MLPKFYQNRYRERALSSLPAPRVQIPQVEGAMNSRAVMKAVSEKWRLLDEQEKTKYHEQADEQNKAALAKMAGAEETTAEETSADTANATTFDATDVPEEETRAELLPVKRNMNFQVQKTKSDCMLFIFEVLKIQMFENVKKVKGLKSYEISNLTKPRVATCIKPIHIYKIINLPKTRFRET